MIRGGTLPEELIVHSSQKLFNRSQQEFQGSILVHKC